MTGTLQTISITHLLIAFIPVLVVLGILYKWSLDSMRAVHAIVRMLVQLLLIGYFLTYLLESDSPAIVMAVFMAMVCFSSWIALGTVRKQRMRLLKSALLSILVGGGVTMIIITQGVLALEPWYWPQYMIPLGGMVFANAMNSVSLAAERLYAEVDRGVPYQEARKIALHASLIPIINSLFAVGLVSLPGMMTGQILSGVSPLIAVRYQIMVMCMIFGSAGISAAYFLVLVKPAIDELKNTDSK